MIVAIIGLGLIGGSLGISLKNRAGINHILGIDSHSDNAAKALKLGLADEIVTLPEAIKRANLFIVSTPMDSMVRIIPELLSCITDHQIVMDVGSTKMQLSEAVRLHPRRNRYVLLTQWRALNFQDLRQLFLICLKANTPFFATLNLVRLMHLKRFGTFFLY